jgi:hypothetical protein
VKQGATVATVATSGPEGFSFLWYTVFGYCDILALLPAENLFRAPPWGWYTGTMAKSRDPLRAAKQIFDEFLSRHDPDAGITPETKSLRAVAAGRKGAQKGGLARAAALSPERRKRIAKKAAKARWSKS